MNESVIDIGMYVTYGLLVVAALSALVASIFQMATNFKKAVPVIIGIAILLAIVFFAYSISTNEAYENASPAVSQWVGGGIKTTMILVGLALVSAIFTEVYKLFR